MSGDGFDTERAGRVVEHRDELGEIAAFIPSDLPPEIHYEEDLVRLVEQAASNLNDLKGTGRGLPDPNIFIQPYLLKEAVVSSQIEGTRTSFEEAVVQADEDPDQTPESRDLQEVRNYVDALEYGMDRLKKEPLTADLIKRIHERLMSGVRGENRSPGEFRNSQVYIGEVGASREDADFVPMPPEEVEDAVDKLVEFVHHSHSMPYLVRSALLHYQFETIHPFEDGNGRLGRLLIVLDMLNEDKLAQPLLYLSEYFNNNKIRYYERLQSVRENGEFERWIKFYLRAVKSQSKRSTRTAVEIIDKRQRYRDRLRENSVPDNCVALMERMFDLRPRTISGISEELDVSYHTARSYALTLEEEGIAEELDRPGREKHYILGEALDIMNDRSPGTIQK